ncbi:MAG: 50S ribosomal protein L24 [Spirochaetes bacterium]|jgi:large subunit ribosomal protein L24|nr:50S ribosomal protein L24 [Spirochaetota bacterium]MBE3129252.1 50S ribosomal protein L24 [Acidobacteriota bacterium]MCX7040790.1 50S ribosomal protein L24 [Spirochaetota bacterium]
MALEAKVKLRKNDVVKVISGREKGKTGRILRIDREKMRALVEGLNMVKKAVKQRKQNEKGGITSIEAPLSVSKLMIVCKKCGPTRIGYKVDGETKKRVCRTCGGEL